MNCWRLSNHGIRKLVFLSWVAIFIYIWTYSSPEGRHNKGRRLAVFERPLSHKKEVYQSDISTWGQPLQTDNYNESKTTQPALTTSKQIVLRHHETDVSKELSTGDAKLQHSKQDINNSSIDVSPSTDPDLILEEPSLSVVYQNKWVGFPDVDGQNCSKALHSGTENKFFPKNVNRISNEMIVSDSKECAYFRINYGFNRYPKVTEEEHKFPIAFIILFHSNLDQVIFLLRALYRPHNVYCLSVDLNAGEEFIKAVRDVARCFPNIFVSSKLETIVYAGFSRLMADINCMGDLLRHTVPWKYVINMPGQQFPLRTNLELVKILTMFNYSNDVETSAETQTCVRNRHILKHIYEVNNITGKLGIVKTDEKNPPPPHGLHIWKGSAYGTFSRDFVRFVVHHPIAKAFLEWNKNVLSPDEYFWASLHYSKVLQVPGGARERQKPSPYLTSYSVWKGSNTTCATKFVRKVCIFSPEDLASIDQSHSLFANKFYISYHPGALHCLDQWLVNRTFSGTDLDLSVYNTFSGQSR